jgi:hypothetical protein
VDGTEEELDAEQLAECLRDPDDVIPDQILWPKAIRSPPKKQERTSGRPSAVGGTAPINVAGLGNRHQRANVPRMAIPSEELRASTGTAREMATTPKVNKRKADVDGPRPPRSPVGGVSPEGKNKGGRPSTSPVKRYLGTTQESSGLWRAQLVVRGKYYSQSGFATEEEAALAWNRLAKMHGRSDYNVLPAMPDPSAGGAAPKRAKVVRGAAEGPAAKPQLQGPESRGSRCMIM